MARKKSKGAEVHKNGGLVRLSVQLTGVSPMLHNAMSQELLLAIRNKVKGDKNAERPSLRDEADGKVYRLQNGDPCVPVKNLFSCLIAAGVYIRLDGKRQLSSGKSTHLPGIVTIEDATLPLYLPGTSKPAPYEVDIDKGVNPNGSEAVCIVRPRFDHWEIRFQVQVDRSLLGIPEARKLFDAAASRIGLCDHRPQKKGTYGRSAVTLWKELGLEASDSAEAA